MITLTSASVLELSLPSIINKPLSALQGRGRRDGRDSLAG